MFPRRDVCLESGSKLLRSLLGASLLLSAPLALADSDRLAQVSVAEHRAAGHADRNRYRNPVETLTFFGIRPDMAVLEISPGGAGWYTEILAPYLRDSGQLLVAAYDPDSDLPYERRNAVAFTAKLSARPELYDRVQVAPMPALAEGEPLAPAESVDMVLTFRNFHGWLGGGVAEDVASAVHAALKPGGVFGVVQHRGVAGNPEHQDGGLGYVDQAVLVDLIEGQGFELDATSEVNANPADPKDHPEGVWELPPSLDGADNERALAIGESDRMTLRFVKR